MEDTVCIFNVRLIPHFIYLSLLIGPNGPGNFYDPKWQEALSDPSDKNKPQRKGILGRMRLPESNSKYDKARAGQAFPYFMPWLSGDGGKLLILC